MSVDLRDEVVSRLTTAKSPMGYAALRKALVKKSKGVSANDLSEAVTAAVNEGRAFHWGNYLNSRQCYWHISRSQWLNERMIELCSENAPIPSRLKVKGFTPIAIRTGINELLKAGTLKKYPGIGQENARIGRSPQAYAAALHEFVRTRMDRAKIPAEVFYAAASFGLGSPQSSPEPVNARTATAEGAGSPHLALPAMAERILGALPTLERPGLEVASVLLRRGLGIDAASKVDFDRAVLDLRDRGQVFLSEHHDPWGLTEHDRMELIDGGDGRYYVSVTLRVQS